MTVRVIYFASLRDRSGVDSESVAAAGMKPSQLYAQLRGKHGFAWDQAQLRVARNGDFVAWDCELGDGDEIAFLPPVSGG
jgi:sulfur-carrier protein